jgi:hypothetical protein
MFILQSSSSEQVSKHLMTESLPTAQIIRSKRKTVALIINPDGTLVVRAPLKLSNQRIEDLIRQKADWIRIQRAKILLQQASIQPKLFINDEKFWYLGELFPLKVVQNPRKPLMITATHFELDIASHPRASKVFEAWYRQQARSIFSKRCDLIAQRMGLKYYRLRLSSARTRWGSCSRLGTISLVWRLVMAPGPVIDYVIIHELIHLRTHNHSKAFWAQVEEVMPDYRTHVRWLKEHGHALRL